MRDAILKVFVFPKQRHMRRVVRVPVLVLPARQRMQIDDCVDALRRADFDGAKNRFLCCRTVSLQDMPLSDVVMSFATLVIIVGGSGIKQARRCWW